MRCSQWWKDVAPQFPHLYLRLPVLLMVHSPRVVTLQCSHCACPVNTRMTHFPFFFTSLSTEAAQGRGRGGGVHSLRVVCLTTLDGGGQAEALAGGRDRGGVAYLGLNGHYVRHADV